MTKNRLEAFSEGVLAIIITIMILEIKIPNENSLMSLISIMPSLECYVLSFVYVGIYWTIHHHVFQAVTKVNGAVLWSNLFLLFWLSFVPFATKWVGLHHFSAVPMSIYGFVLLICAIASLLLQNQIIKLVGKDSILFKAMANDNKVLISIIGYLLVLG